MENKITFINCIRHFRTICKHKFYVFKYCCKFGMIWRGIVHDLSKFSPTEFFESVKYYTGTRSPIDVCKEKNGFSDAWLHHKGRNKHHYEYWQDNFDSGTTHIRMPFKYALEMLCDYLGAAKAYMGKDFTYKGEYEWFLNKQETANAMDSLTKAFINVSLCYMCNISHNVSKNTLEVIYNNLKDTYDNDKSICYITFYNGLHMTIYMDKHKFIESGVNTGNVTKIRIDDNAINFAMEFNG